MNVVGISFNNVWFQQDDASLHFVINFRQFLNHTFPGKWIGRRDTIECTRDWEHGRSQGEQKSHFAICAIVNQLLIFKNRRISPVYNLMQTRDEMRSSCD